MVIQINCEIQSNNNHPMSEDDVSELLFHHIISNIDNVLENEKGKVLLDCMVLNKKLPQKLTEKPKNKLKPR